MPAPSSRISPHPGPSLLPVALPPLLWALLPLAHTWRKTSLAVSFVCVCVCVRYTGERGDRQGSQPPPFLAPPAATIEPGEMWADSLASSAKASRVLREVGDGGEGHGEKGKRKGAGRNNPGDFRTDAARSPAGEARPLTL